MPVNISELASPARRVVSPDGRRAAVTHDAFEYRMGWTNARIVLADEQGRILEEFPGVLVETSHAPLWSEDSAWLAFPVSAGGAFAVLAWHEPSSEFVLIRVENPYPLDIRFDGPHALRLGVRDDQLEAANCQETFGAGRSEAPVRRWRAPEPVSVDLASLSRHPRGDLARLAKLVAEQTALAMNLIADGFHPYDGPGLSSTTQKINGRKLEGHHLEAFAEAGDPVAKAWFAELRERAGSSYDSWAAVAKVLGSRRRDE